MNLQIDPVRRLSEKEIVVCQIAAAVAGSFLASKWLQPHPDLVEQSVQIARLIVERVEQG